jgi:DNA-binding MarR family transcriptional regulator
VLALTTVADHVRAMEERRHVRRTAHPTDRRSTLLSLSAAGLRAHRRASAAFEDADRALGRHLDREAETRAAIRAVADAAGAALIALPARRAG